MTPLESKDYVYDQTGWKDRLVSYDGTAITYDSLGNPTTYRGHNLVWDRVRLLKQYDDLTFDYNAAGLRTRKGDTYYEIANGNIISETTNGNTIRYYYSSGKLVGFRYNGERYFYEKNLQGDIIGIYNTAGTLVGAYTYDAWGNCTVTTDVDGIATVNPFRYRGYYFDSETGLYYLKTRYYDSVVGRFINADKFEYLGSNKKLGSDNLFSYCWNNPVIFVDDTGKSPTGALNLLDYYFIHKLVQDDIATMPGWYTEVPVSGPGGKGRLDVYDANTNTYYEVKSYGVSKLSSTERQMEKYDTAMIYGSKYAFLAERQTGPATRRKQHISGHVQYGIYDVDYSNNEAGLVVYKISLNSERLIETLATFAVGTLFVVLMAVLLGATGGVAALPALV